MQQRPNKTTIAALGVLVVAAYGLTYGELPSRLRENHNLADYQIKYATQEINLQGCPDPLVRRIVAIDMDRNGRFFSKNDAVYIETRSGAVLGGGDRFQPRSIVLTPKDPYYSYYVPKHP